mmetsp:Transcript_8999/g.13882  ORF Transcript_8999/g.13882 Transcript_8999/m.13882 type:complete len:216 (+) Transcript_8999:2-649(+)
MCSSKKTDRINDLNLRLKKLFDFRRSFVVLLEAPCVTEPWSVDNRKLISQIGRVQVICRHVIRLRLRLAFLFAILIRRRLRNELKSPFITKLDTPQVVHQRIDRGRFPSTGRADHHDCPILRIWVQQIQTVDRMNTRWILHSLCRRHNDLPFLLLTFFVLLVIIRSLSLIRPWLWVRLCWNFRGHDLALGRSLNGLSHQFQHCFDKFLFQERVAS